MISIEEILSYVSEYFNINSKSIKSTKRKVEIVYARHIYFFVASKLTDLTLNEIGKTVCRDHSTVSYAIYKIDNERFIYKNVQKDIDLIINFIKMNAKIDIVISDVNLPMLCENYSKSFLK